MNITYFRDSGHQYTCNGERYESVSGLWKPYSKAFNPIEVSTKKAYAELDPETYSEGKTIMGYNHKDFIQYLKDNTKVAQKDIVKLAKSFRDSWSATTQRGTDFHAKEEQKDLDNGFSINPFDGKKYPVVKWEVEKGWDNQSCPGNLFDIPDGYIPELLVSSHKHKLSGQLDKFYGETIDGVRYVDIDDWKTDGEIVVKPKFYNKAAGGFEKMYYPVDHIFNTNYWKYCLKISTYARILEFMGFKIRNLGFTHVVLDDNLEIVEQKLYRVPYKKFEVDLVLNKKIS